MNEQNNGGPAFPQDYDTAMMANLSPSQGALGMTLRDYFAAKALGVMCSSNVNSTGTFASHGGRETVASVCYQMADAMLKARG